MRLPLRRAGLDLLISLFQPRWRYRSVCLIVNADKEKIGQRK